MAADEIFQTLILGGGPAGLGPLICAAQQGWLGELLDSGIALVERGMRIGSGSLGLYNVNSDTQAGSFLECLHSSAGAQLFASLRHQHITQWLEQRRSLHVPLPIVAQYLDSLGDVLAQQLRAHPRSRFINKAVGRSVHIDADGVFRIRIRSGAGSAKTDSQLRARTVILAMGGHQPPLGTLIREELAPGVRLSAIAPHKIMRTHDLLTSAGLDQAQRLLRLKKDRAPIVILGGSHSAFSAAWTLLHSQSLLGKKSQNLKANAILGADRPIYILHRSPMRVFYPSREAAHKDGYLDFDERDLCPLTGRVHRLGGLRGDGRQLYRQLAGLGGEPQERRVQLVPLCTLSRNTEALRTLLEHAALVVPAFGYLPNLIPIFGRDGQQLRLCAAESGRTQLSLVDSYCRVVERSGTIIPGLFAVGLGSGFLPWGAMGGEPSFRGQTNGVWLYQNDIGAMILKQAAQFTAQKHEAHEHR